MSKKLFIFVCIPVMMVILLSPLESQAQPRVFVQGERIEFDVEPVIHNGRIFVPLRITIEALDIKVKWDKNEQSITTVGGNNLIHMRVGEENVTVNGKTVDLNAAPFVIGGRTMVPIRFLSETFGYQVSWNAETKSVNIELPDKLSDQIPVLMYHALAEGKYMSVSVDPDRFKEQMVALKEAGYTTITDYDLWNHLYHGADLPDQPILITFDDGYKSNFTYAFPILKELGMKATIYIVGNRIYEEPRMVEGELEKITWDDAKEMKGTMLIQAHTWASHQKGKTSSGVKRGMIVAPMYQDGHMETHLEYEERVLRDLVKIKETIEEKLGYEVISLAYPYGGYSGETIQLAKEAGYKLAFTVKQGVVNSNDVSQYELKRITADGSYTGDELVRLIESY